MKIRKSALQPVALVLFATLVTTGCQTTDHPPVAENSDERAESSQSYVFGWGNQPSDIATPRGGSSRGSDVTLSPARSLPLNAISSAPNDFEKDRSAILSLAGEYKASFHFLETAGLFPEHETTRPYHSWATEKVIVVEDHGDFISLQHILAMYFEDAEGNISDPMIMKHWRQDWTYQDIDLHTFRGERSWAKDIRDAESVKGTWSQSVWQVDDSPRYAAVGQWSHQGNKSSWTGEQTWRPLPRRERSVRDDYNVMEGIHRITITPTGWLHEQNNWKRVAGEADSEPSYRGHEIGLDRYELIESPSLAKAEAYWIKTAPYWAEVRAAWKEIYATNDRFVLRGKVDGKSQFEHHFEYAGELNDGEPFSQADASGFARNIVDQYLDRDAYATDTPLPSLANRETAR